MEAKEPLLQVSEKDLSILFAEALSLLQDLIATPSFSKEENATASIIETFLSSHGIISNRHLNNVWAVNKYFDSNKKTILLNSHHDTVKPNKGYTIDPFKPMEKEDKLYGLGSNDAGGCLVSLFSTFLFYYNRTDLPWNIVLAATAEEEISGSNGIAAIVNQLGKIECAIVGEPTLMQLAIAERGLLVIDAIATGTAGHAAREEGENALYKAIDDINWIRTYQFPRSSPLLGPVKMTVTSIETENKAHNVVPPECRFMIDIRVNEEYTLEEVFDLLQKHTQSELKARSFRMRSSKIPLEHPLVQAGIALGKSYYGSPTTSDKALMPFPALKMGPGDSARSHMADEYIYIEEIKEGIKGYIELLNLTMK